MKKKIHLWMLAALIMLGAFVCVQGVSAAPASSTVSTARKTGWRTVGSYRYYYKSGKMQTGWLKLNGKYYYLRSKAEGKAPRGSMVTGLYKPYAKTWYFSSSGVMQTGWKVVSGKTCYFRKSGKLGTIGTMYTGFCKVGKYYYLFGDDGNVSVGWTWYKKNLYCFNTSKTLGIRGRASTGWKTIGGYRYYFNAKGVRLTSRWISGKYYVDKNGRMLKSCVTPDGYIVNAKGVKVKVAKGWIKSGGKYYYYNSSRQKVTGWKRIGGKSYYFDSDGVRQEGWLKFAGYTYYLKSGVMQTGWTTISGKKYYFYSNGRMAVSTTVDGVKVGADGAAESSAAEGKASVLIIAGHGMGDPGAVAVYGGVQYQEYKFTRQLATLVYNELKSSGKDISVTMYDQNYDCYQINSKSKTGPLPTWTDYDYVLEIHFNAAAASAKDLKGDGKYKGVGMYVYPSKKDVSTEKKIVSAVSKATGFPIWGRGSGVFTSNLLNARTCYNAGVSYGLLETAFIDDKDDIAFYVKNRAKFAQGIADGILNALGL